jgi:aryl-phospho-beta-D-glucosidase BglC (GH1 family)/20S proteasome alpha/beta subunit
MSGFSLFGVNLSGAEYDPGGTLEGTNYTYPTDAEIDYYASKGMTVIRLPFLLERVEPVPGGPLSTTELGYIDNVVDYAASKGIDVILDPHDYGDEYGTVIGTTAASNATFANFWGELAGHFASTSNVLFGLMNEPNAVTPTQWLASANDAIAAIRAAGATTQQILVPGTDWDGADTWISSGNAQVLGSGIVDPSNNFAFEVHQYLDSDGSGTSSTVVSTEIGVERLTAITQWAEATGNKLFLGEFGVASDPTSLTAMNNMLAYMAQHTDVWEGGTYWAAGPWLGNYMYSIEPTNGVDAPQMGVLEQYVQTTIETSGSTSLIEFGGHYYLNNAAGTGPELEYAGEAVVAGQFGGWAPIGTEQTVSGYDVAFENASTGLFNIWSTDSNGNYISNLASGVSGTSSALEGFETIFHQDLNGDGTVGPPTVVIESSGSTSLIQVANDYFLNAVAGGSGPELMFSGAPVTAGMWVGWAPVGAEQTASGYDVAFENASTGLFNIWSTDSNGNYISNFASGVSGTSSALEGFETIFHQDLNGDGTIGPTTVVIESSGSTSLVQVANEYFLNAVAGGSDPELMFSGAPVTAGMWVGWVPVGTEQTASGYDVAFENASTGLFNIWSTDSNGNYISNLASGVSGTSSALEGFETIFHQDLNGDGVIDTASTVIEATGSIVLTLSHMTQAATIDAGATLELTGADSASVTFNGATGSFILDHSSQLSGQVFNFTGDGNPSSSDQIDLTDIAFGAGTTVSYTGTSSGGTLTVSDAESHTAHIALAGDYTSSTFSLSSDGSGGTVVIDPAAKQDVADGTLSFGDAASTDKQTVSVTPQNAGAGYIGNFIVDAVNTANGQDSVGWHFNFDSGPVAATVTQSYDVAVTDNHADGTHSSATQSVSVTIAGPGNDAFVFHPGAGSETIVNAGSADTFELDGFSSVTNSNQLAQLLSEAQAGHPQSLFATANVGHDTVINLGNHDSITLTNVQLADLHASNFIIG